METVFKTLDENYIKFENTMIEVITDLKGNLWFNAKDVTTALQYVDKNDAINKHTDKDDRKQLKYIKHNVKTNSHPNSLFLSEGGLYSLILSSKMTKAKKFKKWIANLVLPSVQKYGYYKLKNNLEEKNAELLQKLQYFQQKTKLLEGDVKKEKYPQGGLFYVLDYSTNKNEIYRIGITKNMTIRKKINNTHMLHNRPVVLEQIHSRPHMLKMCVRAMLYDVRYRNKKDFYICSLNNMKKAVKICISNLQSITKTEGSKKNQTGGSLYKFRFITQQIQLMKKQRKEIGNKILVLNNKINKPSKSIIII